MTVPTKGRSVVPPVVGVTTQPFLRPRLKQQVNFPFNGTFIMLGFLGTNLPSVPW